MFLTVDRFRMAELSDAMKDSAVVALHDLRSNDSVFELKEDDEPVKRRIDHLSKLRKNASAHDDAFLTLDRHAETVLCYLPTVNMHSSRSKKLRDRSIDRKLDEARQNFSNVLNEDIDRQTMDAAINAIQKLQSIDFSNMPNFDAARDAALADVTSMLAGDDRNFKQKVMDVFRKNDNALYRSLAFASAIHGFFPLFTKFISALTTKNNVASAGNVRIEDIGHDNPNTNANLHKSIRRFVENNFKPKGLVFKSHGSDWMRAYFGSIPLDRIIDDIMLLTLDDLKRVTGDVKRATAKVEIAAEKTDELDVEKSSNAGEPSEKQQRIQSAWKKIKGSLGDVDQPTKQIAQRIMNALDNHALLKV